MGASMERRFGAERTSGYCLLCGLGVVITAAGPVGAHAITTDGTTVAGIPFHVVDGHLACGPVVVSNDLY